MSIYVEVSPVSQGIKVRCDRCGWFTLYSVLPAPVVDLEQIVIDVQAHNTQDHTTLAHSEPRRG